MRVLHIANKNYSSWSLRPWLLMRVLDIPFEERMHLFGEDFGFSPTRRVPVLVEADLRVWDSLAIVEYLAEDERRVWPADRRARAWARSAVAEMHAGFNALREVCSMNCGVRVALHDPAAPSLVADLARLDALWSEGLATHGGPFLAGAAFTAVDAFFAPVVLRAQTYALPLSATAEPWVRRMLALPAMQQWQREALAETARDHAHDADLTRRGRITADLRAAP